MHIQRFAALFLLPVVSAVAMPAAAQEQAGHAIAVAATYGSSQQPRVALFLSGDGGWNLGVVSMAQAVAKHGYLVAGIDFPKYLRDREKSGSSCISIANDLAATATFFAHEHGVSTSRPPLIVGYSSGATGIYAALAQARPDAFSGGLSLGFGADLDTTRPFCTTEGLQAKPDLKLGYIYAPVRMLTSPWIALQGEIDQDVSPQATKDFVSKVGNAKIVMLPKVGHGFSVERNWAPQFEQALSDLSAHARTR